MTQEGGPKPYALYDLASEASHSHLSHSLFFTLNSLDSMWGETPQGMNTKGQKCAAVTQEIGHNTDLIWIDPSVDIKFSKFSSTSITQINSSIVCEVFPDLSTVANTLIVSLRISYR